MVTKAQIKFVRSLAREKFRDEHGLYLVEGEKNALEWLSSKSQIPFCFAEADWMEEHLPLCAARPETQFVDVRAHDLEQMTALKHAQKVVLVVQKPERENWRPKANEWSLFLERVQDPGNMGTIIRTADWFGVSEILLSPGCVDVFNPKVVQATMGSLTRTRFYDWSLDDFKEKAVEGHPVVAAALGGEPVFDLSVPAGGVLALGNESAGLSSELLQLAHHQVAIPGKGRAESLNVGVAAGILLSWLTRQTGHR